MQKRFSTLTFCLSVFFLLGMGTGSLRAGDYAYTLDWEAQHTHTYHISLKTTAASGTITDFQLPAWRPGRYIIQNYSAAVSHFSAVDDRGMTLRWRKTDKDTWAVDNPKGGGEITIRYRYYANVLDAGSSYLGPAEAYFNGANLFMHVRDQLDNACTLTVPKMGTDWKAATALGKTDQHNVFTAASYHDFIDSPTILSPTLKTLEMDIEDVTYYLHFQGNFKGGVETEEALKENIGKIIQAETAVFGEMPLEEYHFIYHLLPYRYRHAVEHKYSASFTLPEKVCESPEKIRGLYGITAHEFWHLWNVKRIRPAAMWPYDYSQQAYTNLHWFTEGVTSYYDQLCLVRAGLLSKEDYFKGTGRLISYLENSYATQVVSPSQSSFDTWLSGSEYENPHHGTSFYSLGQRMGMILDLEMRRRTKGKKSFDDVFQNLYHTYYKTNMGVPEDGVRKAFENVSGESWEKFFAMYIDGTSPIDYNTYFEPFGLKVEVTDEEEAGASRIGIVRKESTAYGWMTERVTPGSDADKAGIGDKFMITLINKKNPSDLDDDFWEELEPGDKISMEVVADDQTMQVEVTYTGNDLPKAYTLTEMENVKKKAQKMQDSWLSGK